MSIFLRLPLGIIVMIIGFLIVWKTETVYEWFGPNDWAEEKMGPGQSRMLYKLIGVGIGFLGIFIATNIISDILGGVASIFVRG